MKKLIVSKRVDIVQTYAERRDTIDQNWSLFIMACGFLPIYVSNSLDHAKLLLKEIIFSGIILTGGNNLTKYGGTAPERDAVEYYLLDHAISHKLPLIGICRGMQLIQDYFKVPLYKVSNHINTETQLKLDPASRYFNTLSNIKTVKTYQQWGTHSSVSELQIIAKSAEDDVVMAVEHREHRIVGQMWHPERSQPFSSLDITLFNQLFDGS